MSTECYSMVRGSAIRVTGLNRNGGIPDPIQYGVSKSVTRVSINEVTETGGNELLRTEADEPRLHFVTPDQMIRFTTDIDFLRCDPGVLSLVSGLPVVENYNGDIVGYDANTRLPAASFALEVWSKLLNRGCAGGEGIDLGFGEMPFGESPFGVGETEGTGIQEYGYTLFPFLKGGYLSGFQFSNGLVSFSLKGAQARRFAKWGTGPYDLTGSYQRLFTPVSGNLMWRTFITTAVPPEQTDGVQILTDVIDGGSASSTSSDILDGQFVVTSSDSVEGGSAA